MVLSEDHSDATYQIQSILPGKIVIGGDTYTNSLIISPDRLVTQWNPDDLAVILELNPEIILLGTGEKSIIYPAKKLACLLEKNFHVECMNTAAACRTYTILIAEGRHVAAGLLL